MAGDVLIVLYSTVVVMTMVPARFLFILLGPLGRGPQYHEMGRSIATLMTDEVTTNPSYPSINIPYTWLIFIKYYEVSSPDPRPYHPLIHVRIFT